jgi:hypothetical protein
MKKILCFSVIAVLPACSLFEPRVPEDPSGGAVVWQTPTSPDIVVDNIAATLGGSSGLYLECLTDDFYFYADTSDVDDYPTLNFSNWDKTVENQTVSQLFNSVPEDSMITAVFAIDPSNPDPSAPTDSAVIYRSYQITVPGSQYAPTGSPASGISELHMVQNSEGLWAVRKWYDSRWSQSQYATWAVTKAAYR